MNDNQEGSENINEENSKNMEEGIEQKAIDMSKESLKRTSKVITKKIASKIISALLPIIIKVIVICVGLAVLFGAIDWILEWYTSIEMPELTYQAMGIDDLSDLVTIQGNETDGYHLEFVEDFDERLEAAIKKLNESYLTITINDKELLRKFILTEISSMYPNLSSNELTEIGVDTSVESSNSNASLTSLDKILFIGDSITVGLEEKGNINGNGCIYRAEVGKDAKYWLDNFNKLQGHDINGICIMIGVNNLNQSWARDLITKLHSEYPDKPIFVQRVLPVNPNYYTGYVTNEMINTYNSAIRSFCEEHAEELNVKYIDTSNNYVNEQGYLQNTDDGLHPNKYSYLADNIEKEILASNYTANEIEEDDEEELEVSDDDDDSSDIEIYVGTPEENAQQYLSTLDLKEKVSQMIMAIASSGDDLKQNVGGYVLLYGEANYGSLKEDIKAAKEYNDTEPIYASDEEGGEVEQVTSGYKSAAEYAEMAEESLSDAKSTLASDSKSKAQKMLEAGVNMNLAPVADLSSSESYMGKYKRSFGNDFNITTELVETVVTAFKSENLMSCLKHFPGYGDGKNTHNGTGTISKSKKELENDIAVFKKGIEAGATSILRSHLYYTNIDSEKPASLSEEVGKIIRNELKFDGIVMTDALNMEAITDIYSDPAELAVQCVKAGNDMIMTDKVQESIKGIVAAVKSGEIEESTIDASVKRILKTKFEYGLMDDYNLNATEQGDGKAFQGSITIKRVMPDKLIGEIGEIQGNAVVDNETAQESEVKELYDAILKFYNENGKLSQAAIKGIKTKELTEIDGKLDELYEKDKQTKKYYNDDDIVCRVKIYHTLIKNELEDRQESGEEGISVDRTAVNDNEVTEEELEVEGETTDGIKTKTINMTYVEYDTFLKYIEDKDTRALSLFTLNDDWELIIADWSYSSSGGLTLKEKSPIDYRSVMQKYTMPYEYLLFFLINGEDEEFSSAMADLAKDSEYIITIQDDVSTSISTTYTTQTVDTYVGDVFYSGGEIIGNSEETVVTESNSSKVELTYADSWIIKLERDNSYYNNLDTYKGTVTDTGVVEGSPSTTQGSLYDAGTITVTGSDGSEKEVYAKKRVSTTYKTTTRTVKSSYESGEPSVIGYDTKADNFVKLYKESSIAQFKLIDSWIIDDMIEKNAKTANMADLTRYLLYKATGRDFGVKEYDFEAIYKDNEFKTLSYGSTDISLTDSVLTRDVFIEALEAYYEKTGNLSFKQNFLSRAGEIYDLGEKYNVNPELIVTMALKESGFKSSGGNQNYWGLGTPNGASLKYIGSFEEGVRQLANSFESYQSGSGTWQEQLIISKYNERKAANCNTNGYGEPGTLKGMLSIYSDLCGENTKHREGDSGDGGNYYLKVIYGEEFEAKCGSVHKLGVDDYTIQEKADYTAWLYEKQLEYWNNIFGEFGSLGGLGGGTIVAEAIKLHEYLRTNGYVYAQAGVCLPNENGRTIDCSSYVTWVLINAGIDGFSEGMYQWTSDTFYSNPHGWQVVSVGEAQPGDIVEYAGHVEIIAENDPNSAYFRVYNCGGNSSINATGTDALPESSMSGRTKASARRILRIQQ